MAVKSIELGQWFGLRLNAKPNAVIGLVILWAALAAVGLWLLRFSPVAALIFGLAVAILHFLSETIHQFGHVLAARRTGYPMSGITFWWVLGMSRYPSDEGELPARIHLYRALGGAPTSLIVAILGGLATLLLHQNGASAPVWWAALIFAADNLLVFTLGALLPLGFTDGSTILRYWKER